MSNSNKYSKLTGKLDYDHQAVEQLAELMNEARELEQRAKQLWQIADENDELKQYVWTTAEGKSIAVHDLEDEHLENILKYILERGGIINRALRGEAISRNIVIPTQKNLIGYDPRALMRLHESLIEGQVSDDF